MRKFLYFFLALVAIICIAIFSIAEKYHFEKTILIHAPADKVYSHINSVKKFNEWNPWLKLDPHMKIDYSGTPGEIGDRYCWDSKSNDAGAGCQEIIELIPNQKQKTKMEFKRPFEDTSYSEIILTPKGNATEVTWTLDAELERPKNLMKLFMDGSMNKSYGEGLLKLKEIAEKSN